MSTPTRSFTAPAKSGVDYPPAPSGPQIARLYMIADVGTHEEIIKGSKKILHKIRMVFELPNCKYKFKEEGPEEPYSVGEWFTKSMSKKSNLRKFIEGWRGKPFENDEQAATFPIDKCLGQTAILNIVHKKREDKTYANMTSATKLMSGQECPPAINKLILYFIEDREGGQFKDIPEWIQKRITSSFEFQGKQAPAATPENEGEPF